jgi:acetyl-CoA carboxylase biotin carboxyl carrier protein
LLTFEQIKELIELIAERRLQGLEVERSGFRLKIDGQAVAPQVVYAAPAAEPSLAASPASPVPLAMPSTVPAAAPAAAQAAEPAQGGLPPGAHVITSPIVGTFYRSPSPDSPPFMEIGSRVKKGQVLCIIEAMKLMNEIESDVDGEILEIYPQNAQPVEFGEPLFAVRATAS